MFQFRNDGRHLVFVEIFSSFPTASYFCCWPSQLLSTDLMQDGDFFGIFFFKLSWQAISFGRGLLLSAKCLHIRHKDILILSLLNSMRFCENAEL